MMDGAAKVGVVIPMYNAIDTIAATLASVCGQTHAALDIVVVNDGSRDGSERIVERWAAKDRRIRLLTKENGGVAAARNYGAQCSDAPVLAFIDADDLWAPRKIELQLEALGRSAGAPALVYCWFVQIDTAHRAYRAAAHPAFEGNVFRHLCRSNFVGNCSSMLMAREVFDRVGGFDPSLRARGAQGCEDLMFLLSAAELFDFHVVPRHLVGYRLTPDNMSSDTRQMLRSFRIVTDACRKRRPDCAAELDAHDVDIRLWLAERAAIGGQVGRAKELLADLAQTNPRRTIKALPQLASAWTKARVAPKWLKQASRVALQRPPRPFYQDMTW